MPRFHTYLLGSLFLLSGCTHINAGGSLQMEYFNLSSVPSSHTAPASQEQTSAYLVERGRLTLETSTENVGMKVTTESYTIP
ncbi:MAG: hypothetical protein RBU29_05305 [bacterium]|jgi:hypothetical protein|nr:hypothetical protein [bacterium]